MRNNRIKKRKNIEKLETTCQKQHTADRLHFSALHCVRSARCAVSVPLAFVCRIKIGMSRISAQIPDPAAAFAVLRFCAVFSVQTRLRLLPRLFRIFTSFRTPHFYHTSCRSICIMILFYNIHQFYSCNYL